MTTPRDAIGLSESEPTQEQIAASERAMDGLEAQADIWAEEISLVNIVKTIGDASRGLTDRMPSDVRAGFINRQEVQIDALARQAYLEGFYRGGTSRKEYDDAQTAEAATALDALQARVKEADEACQRLCRDHGFATGHGDSVADMIDEISAQVKKLIYVPGSWHCPKCKFTLLQSNLNAQDGTVTARDTPGDKCPNCNGPLWRCTWKNDAFEMQERAVEQMERAKSAESRATSAEQERDTLSRVMEDTARELGCASDNEAILEAIARLWQERDKLSSFTQELSNALLAIRPLGGSELFVKRFGQYYADPVYCKAAIEADRTKYHETMCEAVRERKRATSAEQERDEAYERAAKVADKKADDFLSTAARLELYSQATKPAYTEAELHEQAGTAIKALVDDIRRLAAGTEKEGE